MLSYLNPYKIQKSFYCILLINFNFLKLEHLSFQQAKTPLQGGTEDPLKHKKFCTVCIIHD